MNNRMLGITVLVLATGLFFAVYIFTNNTLKLYALLHKDCTLPEGICPYTRSIPTESIFGFGIDGGLVLLGLYLLLFRKETEKFSPVQQREIKSAIKSLQDDEKKIYSTIVDADGFIFQNELVEKIGLNKVKVTRLLDKLEGKNLVERRRRGMSNVIVLKHK